MGVRDSYPLPLGLISLIFMQFWQKVAKKMQNPGSKIAFKTTLNFVVFMNRLGKNL